MLKLLQESQDLPCKTQTTKFWRRWIWISNPDVFSPPLFLSAFYFEERGTIQDKDKSITLLHIETSKVFFSFVINYGYRDKSEWIYQTKWRQKVVCVGEDDEQAETSVSTGWNWVEASGKSSSKELTCKWISEIISQKKKGKKGFLAERSVDRQNIKQNPLLGLELNTLNSLNTNPQTLETSESFEAPVRRKCQGSVIKCLYSACMA